MIKDNENFIIETVEQLPRKKMNRTSRVNNILRTLYDSTDKGKIVKFDPKKAGVNAFSLRYQLVQALRSGLIPSGTRIVSRNKEWFFIKGK